MPARPNSPVRPSSPARTSSPVRAAAQARQTDRVTLVCRNVSLDRGAEPVLASVSFTIGPRACLGVVGPNGVGKTTLLKVLAGIEEPDSGFVELSPPTATCVYVEQERGTDPGRTETVRQNLVRRSGIEAASEELMRTAEALAADAPGARDRYAVALDKMEGFGTDPDSAVDAVLSDAGLDGLADRDTAVLSGGEAAKLALSRGRAFARRHPATRRADQRSGLRRTCKARGPRRLATRGDSGRVARQGVSRANGDSGARARRARSHGEACSRGAGRPTRRRGRPRGVTPKRLTPLYDDAQEAVSSRGRGASASGRRQGSRKEQRTPRDNDKAQRDFRINRTENLAARARRTERESERLEVVDKPWEGWQLRFTINETDRSGDVVARLDRAVVVRGGFRLGPIDLQISWGDRLAIVGRNGAGKSTLVAAILGRITSQRTAPGISGQGSSWASSVRSAGSFEVDDSARGGLRTLRPDDDRSPDLARQVRSRSRPRHRSGASLSPGERTRAELATFQARGVNVLVLDEPTNHLDLPAIEQLEQAARIVRRHGGAGVPRPPPARKRAADAGEVELPERGPAAVTL